MSIPCFNDTEEGHVSPHPGPLHWAAKTAASSAAALLLASTVLSCAASTGTSDGADVNGVAVTPSTAVLRYQETIGFQVLASAAAGVSVTWSVAESSGCGSITQAGLYTAPNSAVQCHVVAQVALGGAAQTASASVNVLPSNVVNSVGINVEGVGDWEPQHFFADVMKTSRYWYSTWPTQAPVDSNGWPTADATLCMATAPGNYGRAEPYKLSFTGRATLVPQGGVTVSNVVYTAGTNTTTADLVFASGTNVNLQFTQTRRLASDASATGVTGVKIMEPGHAVGELFDRDFLARISHFTTIRYTQALGEAGAGIPGNPDVNWADRSKPDWSWQTGKSGIAWEYVILLSNQTATDPWINIPMYASDEYITKLAQLFKYGSDGVNPYTSTQANPKYPPLDPNRRVYVEYVNELWNGAISTTNTNISLAQTEYSSGNSYGYTSTTSGLALGLMRSARRTVEISNLFRAVFGNDQMMVRVRPVYCSQFGNWGTFDWPVNYIKTHYGAPSNYLYGIASAPYVTADSESQDGLTTTQVLDQMTNWVHKSGGFLDMIDAFKKTTAGYDPNLRMLVYEGGPGNIRGHSDDAKTAAQTDPRMGTIVHDLLAKWYSVTAEPFTYYTLCSGTQFGYFGLSGAITDETGPKWDGVKLIVAGQ